MNQNSSPYRLVVQMNQEESAGWLVGWSTVIEMNQLDRPARDQSVALKQTWGGGGGGHSGDVIH